MKTNNLLERIYLLTNGSGPAWMIAAALNVGIKAQNPGNKLYSFTIQMVIMIAAVPKIDKAFLTCVFWNLISR